MRIVRVAGQPPYHRLSSELSLAGANEVALVRGQATDSVADDALHVDAVLAAIPPRWQPDVVHFEISGYDVLPLGLEDCRWSTSAMVMDWNFVAPSICPLLGAYDNLFIDRAGEAVFNRSGHPSARYWPRWLRPPEHAPPKPGARRWDVVFVGLINPSFQRDRAPFLWRVARTGRKHRVAVLAEIWGDEYHRTLADARIVFNRSVKGEANGRVFEAAAAGAVMFIERSNLEAQDFFEDRVHCVYYDERDLESLLDHYLSHESERQAMAARAAQRAREVRELLPRLFGVDDPLELGIRRGARAFAGLSRERRLMLRARHALEAASTPGRFQIAVRWLQQAAHQHDWLIVGELAVAMVMHGLTREGAEKAEWLTLAMKLIDGATRAGTDEPIVWINHAWILKRANHADAACAALDRAVELLRAGRGDLAGLSATLLREGDIVNQARARLFVSPALDEPALVVRLRRFMLHHALVELGQLHLEAARGETAEAALREAVSLEESFGPPRARLAEVLHRRGAIDAGIAELERALTDDPLHDVPAWARLVERLSAQDPTRGAALADELRVICDAMPIEPLLQLKRSLPSGS